MAYSLVQSRMSVVTSSDSQGLSFTSTPSVGNLVIVKAGTYNGSLGTSAVSDNQSGNSYSRRVVRTLGTGSDVAIYRCVVAAASGTFTVTVNPDGSSADLSFVIEEWSGNSATPDDEVNSLSDSGTSVTSFDITPTENNCMWAGAMTHATTDTSITETNGTLVQENEGGSSNMPISATYKIQTTAVSESADWTIGASATWGAVIAAFKAAASSGVTVSLAAASITVAGQALSVTPGAVSIGLNAAAITAGGQTAAITVPAHTFDTSARIPSSGTSTSNPLTGSYTCGAGATVLVLMLKYANSTNRTGGAPTYNGIALTQADQVRKASGSPEGCAELWYLLDPPTGASYTVSIPNSNTKTMVAYVASAKACPGYASALDVAGGNQATSTNPTASVTTTVVGDILFAIVFSGATTWNPSGRTGVQIGDSDDSSWGGGAQYLIKTDSGSQAMAWTFGTSDDWGECVAAFKQIAPTVTLLSAAAISASGQTITVDAGTAGVSVSLSAASISASGQTLMVVPGAVSIGLAAAWCFLGSLTNEIVVGPVSTVLAAGSISAGGQALSVIPGEISVGLNAASITAGGQVLNVVPGAISTSLVAAAITAVGQSITITAPPPGDVTVGLSAAVLAATGQNLTVVPGVISLSLAAAALTISGQILTVVPGAVNLSMSAANLTAGGQALTLVPGAVSTTLNVASLTAVGQTISVDAPVPGTVTVSLSVANLTAGGQSLAVVPGATNISLSAATLMVAGQTLMVVPGAKSTLLSAAGISAVGQTLGVVPGGVSLALSAGNVTISGISIGVIPGVVTINLTAASLAVTGQVLRGVLAAILKDVTANVIQRRYSSRVVQRSNQAGVVQRSNNAVADHQEMDAAVIQTLYDAESEDGL